MKKRLVALVLCVAMLLGCTAVRAEEEYPMFETMLSSLVDFNTTVKSCRYDGEIRAMVALILWGEYRQKVENAYALDFTQPIYVSAFSEGSATDLIVDFFSEDGHHVILFTDGEHVAYIDNTKTPSSVKSELTSICDWTYELSSSDLFTVIKEIKQN